MSELRLTISSGAEVEGAILSTQGADMLFPNMNDKQRVKEFRRVIRSAAVRELVVARIGGEAANEFMENEVSEIS